jgi:hypothetical protein
MGNTLATMLTMTTYGTWLRGDRRGWVEDGIIFPPDPDLESADRARMKHSVYLFPRERLLDVGNCIGTSLVQRLQLQIFALHVGTWHVHIVIGPTIHHVGEVTKCAKDAARYGLRPGRPIWTERFDKRFCFDTRTVLNRIHYVERHNEAMGWPAKPWPFVTPYVAPGH